MSFLAFQRHPAKKRAAKQVSHPDRYRACGQMEVLASMGRQMMRGLFTSGDQSSDVFGNDFVRTSNSERFDTLVLSLA